MATIQIRNIPDDVHETYVRRAAAAGQSLQEYLRVELIEGAAVMSPAELVEQARAAMRRSHGEGYARISSAEAIREDRMSH